MTKLTPSEVDACRRLKVYTEKQLAEELYQTIEKDEKFMKHTREMCRTGLGELKKMFETLKTAGIEEKEIKYSLKNNKFLAFGPRKNNKALKELDLDLTKAKYYDYAVVATDNESFHIIAQLRPKIIKQWFLNGPNTKLELIYEKEVGKTGRILN